MIEKYKVIRNLARQLPLKESLEMIWKFFLNIGYNRPLPADYSYCPIVKSTHPWELSILAREIILHASNKKTKSLNNIRHYQNAINDIRRVSNMKYSAAEDKDYVFHELQRAYRQQSLWSENNYGDIYRCFKIYSYPELSAIFKKEKKLSVANFYIMGISLFDFFTQSPYLTNIESFSTEKWGIDNNQRDIFFSLLLINFNELKERTRKAQRYDDDWAYTINPLVRTPLIRLSGEPFSTIICPIPAYIKHRITDGIFFDISDAKGYEGPYGKAFEKYLFHISQKMIGINKGIDVIKPKDYYVNKRRKDGADLVVLDNSGMVTVEAKCKRLRLNAQYKLKPKDLYDELEKLSGYIVQNYKNIKDIIDGCTEFDCTNKKIFSVVVTLSNWKIFTTKIYGKLEDMVKCKLTRIYGNADFLEKIPYVVMSASEYEIFTKIIGLVGISEFFRKVFNSKYEGYLFPFAMEDCFPEELKIYERSYAENYLEPLVEELTNTNQP